MENVRLPISALRVPERGETGDTGREMPRAFKCEQGFFFIRVCMVFPIGVRQANKARQNNSISAPSMWRVLSTLLRHTDKLMTTELVIFVVKGYLPT